jgi:hypothetical protein
MWQSHPDVSRYLLKEGSAVALHSGVSAEIRIEDA